jgi:hypothetical protein
LQACGILGAGGAGKAGEAEGRDGKNCRNETLLAQEEHIMVLIRDIFFCKPGKVRPMVDKFKKMKSIGEKHGLGKMRVMTDVSAERFWTVVTEFEVETVDAFMKMDMNAPGMKDMMEVMKDYHDFVDHGRREIYTIEG